MFFSNTSRGLIKGRGAFMMVAPGPPAILAGKAGKVVGQILKYKGVAKALYERKPIESIIGGSISGILTSRLWQGRAQLWFTRTCRTVDNTSIHMRWGMDAVTRTWYNEDDASALDNRIVRKLIVNYHDAYKAGKHLDVHLGHLSLVYRITGKPVENQIKYNSKGELTQDSKDALIKHLRAEIANNSRTPWNHDHTVSNAKCSWLPGTYIGEGYGAGNTRQVILEDEVEFYHPRVKTSLHFYAPALNPDQGMYVHELYPGDESRTPILVCGNLIPRDSKFEDRLHLKMIKDEEFRTKFLDKVDLTTITRKYDGASTYFTSNGLGFKFFSPRHSKVTGHRIEYTYKLCEMADYGSIHNPEGMAELLFWKHTPIGKVLALSSWKGVEGLTWKYLTAAEIGGILNSNKIRPRTIYPEVRVYRMDKWDGNKVIDLPFHENRVLQQEMINELNLPFWKLTEWAIPLRSRTKEGLVGVLEGDSINNGYKIKWWGDAKDWQVTDIQLGISPKGAIDGIIEFRSLESGRLFYLGPGQIGSAEECMDIMENPKNYIGRVAKVSGRHGHEGRAAKLLEWHLDK
jgi:hypothetical protein